MAAKVDTAVVALWQICYSMHFLTESLEFFQYDEKKFVPFSQRKPGNCDAVSVLTSFTVATIAAQPAAMKKMTL